MKENFPKIESKSTENRSELEYWQKFDQELCLPFLIASANDVGAESDDKMAEISQSYLQQIADLRAENNISPVQGIEQDIFDIKSLLVAQAEANLLSEKVSPDSAYRDHLLLLLLNKSGLDFEERFAYQRDKELAGASEEEILDNNQKKKNFYNEAKTYLFNRDNYNYQTKSWTKGLSVDRLDEKAILVFRELELMTELYKAQDFYYFNKIPSFVADDLVDREETERLYHWDTIPRFESLSNKVLKDMFNNGNYFVIDYLKNNLDKFPQVNPLWAWSKILKLEDSYDLALGKFLHDNIKNDEDLSKAYRMSLNQVLIKDNNISPRLRAENREQYIKQRDDLDSELNLALGKQTVDHYDYQPTQFRNLDPEKTYELIDRGYGPLILNKLSNAELNRNLDRELIIDKLAEQKQSCYILKNHHLRSYIDGDILAAKIISEGDIDILAANLNKLKLTNSSFVALLASDYKRAALKNINSFSQLNEASVSLLKQANKEYLIVPNLDKFSLNKASLENIINDNLDRIIESVNLNYLEENHVFDYFLKQAGTKPDILNQSYHKGFIALSLENQNKFANVIVKTTAAKDFLVYLVKKDILANLDFTIEGDELDEIIEDAAEASFASSALSGLKNKPVESFYVENIKLFTDTNNKTGLSYFLKKLKEGAIERELSSFNLVLRALNELGKTIDETALESYLKNVAMMTETERQEYLKELKQDASDLAQNIPSTKTANPNYELSLRLVYPSRNYDSYKHISSYEDRTEDIAHLEFDRSGQSFNLDGISGYQLKAGREVDQVLIDSYAQRLSELKAMASKEALMDYLAKELPGSKLETLEAKLIEYLNEKGYNPDSLNLVLAYQLIGEYQQFADNSRDRLKESDDQDSKNYILLDEILEQYGDRLKETVKRIKEEIEKSSDINLLETSESDNLPKLLAIGEKIDQDLAKIPSDKLSDDLISKKIERTLRNILQNNEYIKENAKKIATQFKLADMANFSAVWQEKMTAISSVLGSGLKLSDLERAQSKIYQDLQKELIKFEEITEIDEELKEKKMPKKREIKGYFSKNRENAHARMVADVCIASDASMWEDREYFEFVLFDEARSRCMGTTMLKTINDSGKKYLLYSPNPSVGLVSEVSAKKLYKKITEEIINLAKNNDYDAVIMDKSIGKSTNRGGLFHRSLENSCLREDGKEIVINLEKEQLLSSYSYQKDLRAVYIKREE